MIRADCRDLFWLSTNARAWQILISVYLISELWQTPPSAHPFCRASACGRGVRPAGLGASSSAG